MTLASQTPDVAPKPNDAQAILADAARHLRELADQPAARNGELAEIMTHPVVVDAIVESLRCESEYVVHSLADAALSSEEMSIASVVLGRPVPS